MGAKTKREKIIVNYRSIKDQATAIANEQWVLDFQFTDRIAINFCLRNKLTMRVVTHRAQQDNRPIAERYETIIDHLNGSMTVTSNIPAEDILNMDEIPCYIDMISNRTIDFKGEKSIEAADTGHGKTRFTVVLTTTMGGEVLRVLIILKGLKKVPKMQFPKNFAVTTAPGGSMREDIMHKWIGEVIDKRGVFKRKKSCALFMDSYGSHKKESVLAGNERSA
ncbi:MAG: hypothetical protein AAF438_23470 [Pseudomonadota bacterium]